MEGGESDISLKSVTGLNAGRIPAQIVFIFIFNLNFYKRKGRKNNQNPSVFLSSTIN
jgi:hypothetical protein